MFKKMFKRTSEESSANNGILTVYAPVSGEIVPLETVEDPVFAQKMVGDGIAVMPASDTIVAPVAGTLTQLFPTGHAAGITTPDGIEILIHVGHDTVDLKGEGFTKLATQGQQVEIGTPLIQLDLPRLKETARSLVTPVIITNMQAVKHLEKTTDTHSTGANQWLLRVQPQGK